MGGRLESPPAIHVVRNVSPGKIMLCVSFRVPEAVAFAGRSGSSKSVLPVEEGSEAKRQRT